MRESGFIRPGQGMTRWLWICRLYVKKEILAIKALVLEFMEALCASAEENLETVMPGYTHLQRAQPVTFGIYDGLCQ